MDYSPGQKGKHWISEVTHKKEIEIGSPNTPEGIAPSTLVEEFKKAGSEWGDKNVFHVKRNDVWNSYTWNQYYDTSIRVAKSLIHLGLKEFDVVSMSGFNSPEYFFACMGSAIAGGIFSGVYPSNSPEACKYQINSSKSRFVFVENHKHLIKFLPVKDEITAFIQWSGTNEDKISNLYTWDDFLALGDKIEMSEVEKRMSNQTPERVVCLMYTSGTTGYPKGVMISNDNISWTVTLLAPDYGVSHKDSLVSYLPLSHVAAMMLDLIAPIYTGFQIYFAQPDALKGSLIDTLKEVRPTLFVGMPRVWEKIQSKLTSVSKKKGLFFEYLFSAAKYIGYYGAYAMQNKQTLPWGWWITNKLILDKIKYELGLNNCRISISSAAPISMETLNFFMSLNIPILEFYGSSESTGPVALNYPNNYKIGSVGPKIGGSELMILNPDQNGEGEILFKGRNVFVGYLNNEKASAETIDSKGFYHTGDTGKLDEDGYLYITGRIKDFVKTSGGEKVAPGLIESEIKKILGDCISNLMVIGDKRQFLTCVFTLPCESDKNASTGAYPFTNQLKKSCIKCLQQHGISSTTVEDAMKDEKLQHYFEESIEEANKHAISSAQKVQKFQILPKDFSMEEDFLTPTLKLKRRVVLEKYKDLIDSMYQERND